MTFTYLVAEQERKVTVEPLGGRYRVTVGDTSYDVAAQNGPNGALYLDIDGQRLRTFVASDDAPPDAELHEAKTSEPKTRVWIDGDSWAFVRLDGSATRRRRRSLDNATSGSLVASMPGQVLEVHVVEGDLVKAGDPVMTLEAMKMQSRLTAPRAGRIEKVHCQAGDVVARGQVLVEIE